MGKDFGGDSFSAATRVAPEPHYEAPGGSFSGTCFVVVVVVVLVSSRCALLPRCLGIDADIAVSNGFCCEFCSRSAGVVHGLRVGLGVQGFQGGRFRVQYHLITRKL